MQRIDELLEVKDIFTDQTRTARMLWTERCGDKGVGGGNEEQERRNGGKETRRTEGHKDTRTEGQKDRRTEGRNGEGGVKGEDTNTNS
jgi:hypothetical protein